MASSKLPPGFILRALTAADLPQALTLSQEAGWNQVAADWRIFLDLGAAFAVTVDGDRLVATAATLPHDRRFGWISMVLVTAAQRRRGIAQHLLGRCVAALTAQGLVPALDATPAGRAVYLDLGFHDAWGLRRLVQRRLAPSPPSDRAGIGVRPLTAADWPALIAYDTRVFGADRAALLRRLAVRLPQAALVAERDGALVGFVLGRDGRVMTQIGPLEADDHGIARALLTRAAATVERPVVIDLADRHGALGSWLEEAGFATERPLTRMIRDRAAAFDDAARLIAIAGPELG